MSDEQYSHRAVAWWTSGRTGLAKCNSAPNAIHFTAPPEFGGLEGRWTPEDLLLGAAAGCFTTTFHSIARSSKFDYIDLEVEAETTVQKAETGYTFNDITIRAHLTVPGEEVRDQALRILEKTRDLCLISRALATRPKLEMQVEVGKGLAVVNNTRRE
jgi:organic hydroperoxide reductase OsmC/OhrA